MSEKYAETLKQSVKTVIDSSIQHDLACSMPDRPLTIWMRLKPECQKYEDYNSSVSELNKVMGKWNEIFAEWGLPMELVGEKGASRSIVLPCLRGSAEQVHTRAAQAIPSALTLTCPPMTPDIAPSVRRTLGPVSYTHLTLPTNREV